MLAIRMQRNGRTHYPTYRIVVQESQRHPLSGRVVAEVGNYNPATKALTLDKGAVEKYLTNGAQPSSRVAFILKKNGVKLPKWYKEPNAKKVAAKHADKLRKNQPKEEPAADSAAEAKPTEAPAEAAPEATAETAEKSAE
ncbi:30S ribosomal protein S16 [Candidatus Saccharibacteria bacterium]|nr:30S ribosomal protein S16 [Candidatus Saccharibacteria bacterium]